MRFRLHGYSRDLKPLNYEGCTLGIWEASIHFIAVFQKEFQAREPDFFQTELFIPFHYIESTYVQCPSSFHHERL
jgi:hypothetical protein